MTFHNLYKSVFAILRVEGTNGMVAGTGFVINKDPFLILTCNHVVGEGTENNDGSVIYSITKRSDTANEFDLRKIEISFIRAKKIWHKPEFDLAILEIDPNENIDIAAKLDMNSSIPLELSFDKNDREIGGNIEWLSTAASGDISLTPRFFKGNLVTNYLIDQSYNYTNNQKLNVQQVMVGVNLLEVDKLFIPGSSGSPILNVNSNKVIGFVHGFKSWPIETNNEISQQVEITDGTGIKNVQLKYALPLLTSLSLGIDLRTVESYLRDEGFI